MKKLLSIAVLACFIGAIGCSDTVKKKEETKTTTNPDGSKTTETKTEKKEVTPPK